MRAALYGGGEDLDVREREFPSGGTEDPNEGGTVVWNCWVKRTDIDSVISPPMKEPSQGMGRGIKTRGPCGSEEPRDGGNPRTPIESSEEGFELVEPWVCGEPLSVLLSGLSFISEVGNVDSPGEGDQSTQGSTPREGHVEDQYDFEDIISLENRLDDFQRWCDETGVESMSSGLWTEKELKLEKSEGQPCEKRTCRAIRRSGKKS